MIIGLMGQAGSGKSTAGGLLEAQGFQAISLADPMKDFVHEVFGFPAEHVWGASEKREIPSPEWGGLTPRKALQTLGTEWGRGCHQDVWVRYALRTAKAMGGNVVITDVRFRNEMNAIQAAGGKVLRLVRDTDRFLPGRAHLSETEQEGIPDHAVDAVVENNRSLEELAQTLGELVGKWTSP